MPIFFFQAGRLVPEYRRLPAGDPAEAVYALLQQGSRTGRDTAMESNAQLIQSAEAGSGFVLEMSDDFWSGSSEDVYRRAAQLVFSLAVLEEGKQITLLDGTVPGRIETLEGTRLRGALERADFEDVAPWIEVFQPVAGSLVANPIPVEARTVDGRDWSARLIAEGGKDSDRSPPLTFDTDASSGVVRIVTEVDGEKVVVGIPVRLSQG